MLVIVPVFIWMFLQVRHHCDTMERETRLPSQCEAERTPHNVVVVPIARLNWPAVQALEYARSLSPEATAVHVASDTTRAAELEAAWPEWGQRVPLTIVESPYRSLTRPLLQHLLEVRCIDDGGETGNIRFGWSFHLL